MSSPRVHQPITAAAKSTGFGWSNGMPSVFSSASSEPANGSTDGTFSYMFSSR